MEFENFLRQKILMGFIEQYQNFLDGAKTASMACKLMTAYARLVRDHYDVAQRYPSRFHQMSWALDVPHVSDTVEAVHPDGDAIFWGDLGWDSKPLREFWLSNLGVDSEEDLDGEQMQTFSEWESEFDQALEAYQDELRRANLA